MSLDLTLAHQVAARQKVEAKMRAWAEPAKAPEIVEVSDDHPEFSVDLSTDGEPQPEQASGIPLEEEVLSQASEDEVEPHPADLDPVSPVASSLDDAPSSYTAASAEMLTKLQIVEILLARQGVSPDSVVPETARLQRFSRSVLISRLLAEPVSQASA